MIYCTDAAHLVGDLGALAGVSARGDHHQSGEDHAFARHHDDDGGVVLEEERRTQKKFCRYRDDRRTDASGRQSQNLCLRAGREKKNKIIHYSCDSLSLNKRSLAADLSGVLESSSQS